MNKSNLFLGIFACMLMNFSLVFAVVPAGITTDTNNDMIPSALIDTGGTVYAVYASDREGNYEVFYQTSNDGGSVWSAPTRITTSGSSDYSPAIMQDAQGKYFIAYSSDSTGNKEVWYVTSADGSSWSAPVKITDSSENKMRPSIIQDSSGKYWVSWTVSVFEVGEGQVDKMQYQTSLDGTTWGNVSDFSIDAAKTTNARLSGFSGTYCVVYESNGAIYHSKSSNGETWSAPVLISTGTDNSEPMHLKDSSGNYHITWTSTSSGNNDLYHSSSDTGTSWSAPSAITIHPASDTSGYLLQGASGDFWLFFRSDRVTENRDIWFMKDTTIPLETEPVTESCGDSVCSISESCETCPSDCECAPPEPPNPCNGVACPEKCEGTTEYKGGYCVGEGVCAYAVIVENSEVCGYIEPPEPMPDVDENQTIDEIDDIEDDPVEEIQDNEETEASESTVPDTVTDGIKETKDMQTEKQESALGIADDSEGLSDDALKEKTEEDKSNTELILFSLILVFLLLFLLAGIGLYIRSKNKNQETNVEGYYE